MNQLTAFALLLTLSSPARAAAPLVEQEQALSARLQARLQAMADELLGPGRSVASVRVELEAPRHLQRYLERKLIPPARKKEEGPYKWTWAALPNAPTPKQRTAFVLPGIKDAPAVAPAEPKEGRPEPTAEERELAAALETRVRRVDVHLSVDAGVAASAAAAARDALAAAAGADAGRGDRVQLARLPMPRPYERLWSRVGLSSDPAQLLSQASRFLLAAGALLALGLCLFAANRWLKRLESAAERFITLVKRRQEEPAQLAAPDSAQPPALEGPAEDAGQGGRCFNIGVEDVPKLCDVLAGQEPANIALVLPFLKPEVHRELVRRLPVQASARALAACAAPRFIEPELIEKLGRELEGRVRSAVGGDATVIDLVRRSPAEQRDQLLRELQRADGALAARVRSRVLLLGDLWTLPDEELAATLERVDLQSLAVALSAECGEARSRALGLLSGKARAAVEQGLALAKTPQPSLLAAARGAVLAVADELLEKGRIHRDETALAAA